MNINITLFGQMITFALFVWFTMRYVWPPLTQALHDRQKKIAEGLAAAERGVHELELAQQKAKAHMREAKLHAAETLEQANKRSVQIIEQARIEAKKEGERMIVLAKEQIQQQLESAKQSLRQQIVQLAIHGAERILEKNIDTASNSNLIDKLITEI